MSSFATTSVMVKPRRRPPVWLRSIYLKTLRDYRVPILGWGIGMGLVIVSPMASVSELVRTPEARAALVSLAQTFVWNADAIAADTVGGYATFKIGIFIFLIVVDMDHRVIPNTDWISRLSPIYYYNLGRPLVPTYGVGVAGMLVLLALAVALSASAVWLFARRDIGDTVPLPRWLRLSGRVA